MHKKLIRDKVPELAEAEGVKLVTKILENQDFEKALKVKLIEEAKEVSEAKDDEVLEELADVLEVVFAFALAKGLSLEDLEIIRQKKLKKAGGFEKRLFLVDRHE